MSQAEVFAAGYTLLMYLFVLSWLCIGVVYGIRWTVSRVVRSRMSPEERAATTAKEQTRQELTQMLHDIRRKLENLK